MSVHHRNSREPSIPARRLALISILLLGFALRVTTLTNQGLWRDEVDQWLYTQQAPREWLAKLTQPGWNGPLFTPTLKGWILLAGDSVFAMRFLSVIFGMLALVMTYALTRRLVRCFSISGKRHKNVRYKQKIPSPQDSSLRESRAGRGLQIASAISGMDEGARDCSTQIDFSKPAATWAMFITAISPYMVYYAQEIKMYTLVPFLALTALYAVERARGASSLGRSWGWWALALISTSLAMYNHILAALLIPVVILWVILRWPPYKRGWIAVLVLAALLILPYIPMYRWQVPLLFKERATGYNDYTLLQMLDMLAQAWPSGITQGLYSHNLLIYGTAGYFGLLALLGVAWLFKDNKWQRVMQLFVWMLLPLLGIWFVSLWGPIFTDRYVIWSAPTLYILVGVGLAWLGKAHRWLPVIAVIAILASNALSLHAQATVPIKPRFNEAAEFIESERQPEDALLFQIPYNAKVYQYYVRDPGVMLEAPYTNYRMEDGSYQVGAVWVEGQMRMLLDDIDAVWLIYSEVELWDEREMVLAWLEQYYTLETRKAFPYVEVFRFVKP